MHLARIGAAFRVGIAVALAAGLSIAATAAAGDTPQARKDQPTQVGPPGLAIGDNAPPRAVKPANGDGRSLTLPAARGQRGTPVGCTGNRLPWAPAGGGRRGGGSGTRGGART